MTFARSPAPTSVRRRRWGVFLSVAAVAVVVGYLAFGEVGKALVYYETPSELLARGAAAIGQPVRLGGLVKPGSIVGPATDLRFVLSDGTRQVTIHSTRAPASSFRAGVGAVVEGTLRSDGVFEATSVLVKHDENYVVPSPGAVPTQAFVPSGN